MNDVQNLDLNPGKGTVCPCVDILVKKMVGQHVVETAPEDCLCCKGTGFVLNAWVFKWLMGGNDGTS